MIIRLFLPEQRNLTPVLMSYLRNALIVLPLLSFFWSCQPTGEQNASSPAASITTAEIDEIIKTLSDDAYAGRKPFGKGDSMTVNYLVNAFTELGLSPGNGDSFLQDVPMVEITSSPSRELTLQKEGIGALKWNFLDDFVASSRYVQDSVVVSDAELVFAGFGIVAPEYNWNDYEGVDMEGKIAVVYVNDPGFGSEDTTFFKGNTMTYYGRWTYKYEEATRQGAAGCLIIHNTAPAGYPWGVVRNGFSGSSLYLQTENNNLNRAAVEGWITGQQARNLFQLAGISDPLGQARKPGFRPQLTGITTSFSIKNTFRSSVSQNVMAKLEGKTRPEEVIIYSSHWDHMGTGEPVNGDSIYNGALDNASGVACMLEIADAFTQMEETPDRSVIFLAVTAEEQGLLGSAWYAANPVYPLQQSVANINMDQLYPFGKMKDLTIVGYGQSELEEMATILANAQGRYIIPDPQSEKGFYFRSDHFSFARVGIPALYAAGEHESAEHGVEWTTEKIDAFTAERYHKVGDEYGVGVWNLEGMQQDARLYFRLGRQLANSSLFPQWKSGSEFKATRQKYMNEKE